MRRVLVGTRFAYVSHPTARPKTCWTDQPQLFLFGYEALSYDARDPKVAVLHVRPAAG